MKVDQIIIILINAIQLILLQLKLKWIVEKKNVLMEEFQELTTEFGESKLDNVLISNIITNAIKILQ